MKNFEEKAIKDLSQVQGGINQKFEVTATVEENDKGEVWARTDFKWVQNSNK
jgi:hypothetical protein